MKTIIMTITKLLCFAVLLGLSCGSHVHRSRRENTEMKTPVFADMKGMYMSAEQDVSGRNEPEPGRCKVTGPNSDNDYDFVCGFKQQIGTERPIGNLVLNHTDSKHILSVIWSELEASLSPKSITFVGVTMTHFNQTDGKVSDSTIKKLTFDHSNFTDVTENAFQGLKSLEELRFLHCNILKISQHAVSNHNRLNTIEIIESIVGVIHENAFLNLPAIEHFVISFSILAEIKGQGINLNTNDEAGECLPSSRSGKSLEESLNLLDTCMDSVIGRQAEGVHDHNDAMHTFDSVMGRQIQGARGLNLPEFGKQFLLYQNKIESIRSNAINSNAFGFLILGGNDITLIESKAFKMKLHNPCEISAALFAQNSIAKLADQSFAGISNKMNSNNTTFISLMKNKFEEVQAQSFQIENDIKIFSVDENIFKCECMNLFEFLKDQQALISVQAELKTQIISKANCTTGVGLTTFKYSCDEFSTLVPEPHRKFTPTPQPDLGTTSTASHSNLASLVITSFILMLINKIVP